MTLLDMFLIVLIVLATLRGLQAGLARQLLSISCFLAGLVLGAAIAPKTAGLVKSDSAKVAVTLITLVVAATVVGTFGEAIGRRVGHALRRIHLGPLDAGLGAAFGAVGMLVVIWLVAAMLASAPLGDLGRAIQSSLVVRELDARMPPSPSVIARIQRFLDPLGFPRVFAGLEPDPGPPVDLPGTSALRPAIDEVSRSTLRIEAIGCGGFLTGSGFVAAPDLVVTNAHVVAGTHDITVRDGDEARRAVPVVFDPETDLAVLRVSGLSAPPLTLATGELSRGTGGAVLGYPGGGPLTTGPAAVLQAFDARGRDIYDDGLTTRAIYTIEATVRPGNSGGPFILPDGRVAGVVFARSVSDGTVGYALQASEVVGELQAANGQSTEVGTGHCAAD